MDRGSRHYPPGDIRVSDADRDRALGELGEAFKTGRITADELDERSAHALAARTGDELTALLADLPVRRAPATPTTAQDRARVALAARVTAVAAVAALCVTAVATAGAALSMLGPTAQERALAGAVAAAKGAPPPVFPPSPGLDWAGVMTPTAIAVLLMVLLVHLRGRLARPG